MKQKQLTNGLVELTPEKGKLLRLKGPGLIFPVAPVRPEMVGEFEEIDPPAPQPYSHEEYKAKTVGLIRRRYDGDDEAALLRKVAALLLSPAEAMSETGEDAPEVEDSDRVVAEFREYNEYAERCKAEAIELLTAKDDSTTENEMP